MDSPQLSQETVPAPPDGPARPSPLTLPVVLVGVVLVAMSISGTAIALPRIGRDLDASGSALNWVVAGYNLAFAAMTLVAGAAADRFGRRKILVLAAALFALGFVATAFARSIVFLDVMRILSGIGGAGVMAAGGAVLASTYQGAALNRAFAFMGTMAGVGIAIGPTLVGGLIAITGWRGSFVLFAVVGALVALGASRLAESRSPGGRIDRLGSLFFVFSLSAYLFVLMQAPELGWAHPVVVALLVAGTVGFIGFALVQRRSAAPVLSPELVGNHRFMGWCLATLTTSIGFLGALVFLPTYLQAVAGYSPAAAGLAMLLLTAPVLLAPMLAVSLVNRGVSARGLIFGALLLVVGGNFGLLLLGPTNTVAFIAAPLLVIGTGMGISFGITDGQAMSLVPSRLVGTAAGFLNTLRGAAEALVIAVFSAALLGVLTSGLGDSTRAFEVAAGRLSAAGTPAYASEVGAFTASWHLTQLGVGTGCLLLSAAVVILLCRPRRAGQEDENAHGNG